MKTTLTKKEILTIPIDNLLRRESHVTNEINETCKDNIKCYNLAYSGDCIGCVYGSYLSFCDSTIRSHLCSHCFYCENCTECQNCYHCNSCHSCSFVACSSNCVGCMESYSCRNCVECVNCYNCDNCFSCYNCFGLNGAKNKHYVVFGTQLTKEQWKMFKEKNKLKDLIKK